MKNWIRQIRLMAGLVMMSVFLAACQSAQEQSADPAEISTAPRPEYRLDNGDKLRVTVFGEPDLSGDFLVDGTGTVSLPLIGEISTAGKTLREFQRLLEEKLKLAGFSWV